MTADNVRAALDSVWGPAENVIVDEAPTDASRQGTKIDRLVISCWPSRGLELDGIEIKVSLSDFRRELKNTAKGDWWWWHVHRFWLAVPEPMAKKVKDELPSGWGLLACSSKQTRVMVKPEKHDAERLPWTAVVGLMRTVNGAGWGALQRRYDEGYQKGLEAGRRQSGDDRFKNALDELRTKVDAFEESSGMRITGWVDAKEVGEMVNVVMAARRAGGIGARLSRAADMLDGEALTLRELVASLNGHEIVGAKEER